jgi:hypothetical protein
MDMIKLKKIPLYRLLVETENIAPFIDLCINNLYFNISIAQLSYVMAARTPVRICNAK